MNAKRPAKLDVDTQFIRKFTNFQYDFGDLSHFLLTRPKQFHLTPGERDALFSENACGVVALSPVKFRNKCDRAARLRTGSSPLKRTLSADLKTLYRPRGRRSRHASNKDTRRKGFKGELEMVEAAKEKDKSFTEAIDQKRILTQRVSELEQEILLARKQGREEAEDKYRPILLERDRTIELLLRKVEYFETSVQLFVRTCQAASEEKDGLIQELRRQLHESQTRLNCLDSNSKETVNIADRAVVNDSQTDRPDSGLFRIINLKKKLARFVEQEPVREERSETSLAEEIQPQGQEDTCHRGETTDAATSTRMDSVHINRRPLSTFTLPHSIRAMTDRENNHKSTGLSVHRLNDTEYSTTVHRLNDTEYSTSVHRLNDTEYSTSVHRLNDTEYSTSVHRLNDTKYSTSVHRLNDTEYSTTVHRLNDTEYSPSVHRLNDTEYSTSVHRLNDTEYSASVHRLNDTEYSTSVHRLNDTEYSPSVHRLNDTEYSPSVHRLNDTEYSTSLHKLNDKEYSPSVQRLHDTEYDSRFPSGAQLDNKETDTNRTSLAERVTDNEHASDTDSSMKQLLTIQKLSEHKSRDLIMDTQSNKEESINHRTGVHTNSNRSTPRINSNQNSTKPNGSSYGARFPSSVSIETFRANLLRCAQLVQKLQSEIGEKTAQIRSSANMGCNPCW